MIVENPAPRPSSVLKLPSPILQVVFGPQVATCPPQPLNSIRIVCISDTHTTLERAYKRDPPATLARIPDGDVLIHAGDFTNTGSRAEIDLFVSFIKALPHRHKCVVAGNHELSLDPGMGGNSPSALRTAEEHKQLIATCQPGRVFYLQDSSVTIGKLNFYGSPWQPEFGGWAFNVPLDELKPKWDLIPSESVHVLITHGPAAGHVSRTRSGVDAGCPHLLEAITQRVKPKLHVCGHIHEAYGVSVTPETVFVNASTCTLRYTADNYPVIVDVQNS